MISPFASSAVPKDFSYTISSDSLTSSLLALVPSIIRIDASLAFLINSSLFFPFFP